MECCGPARACTLQGFDQDRQKIFLFERPFRADMCCLGCCLMEIKAYTAQRELIGTVHQRYTQTFQDILIVFIVQYIHDKVYKVCLFFKK